MASLDILLNLTVLFYTILIGIYNTDNKKRVLLQLFYLDKKEKNLRKKSLDDVISVYRRRKHLKL